jgi:hypothetical protein
MKISAVETHLVHGPIPEEHRVRRGADLTQTIAPMLVGEEAGRVEYLWEKIYHAR